MYYVRKWRRKGLKEVKFSSFKRVNFLVILNLFLMLYIITWITLPVFKNFTSQGAMKFLFIIIIVLWFLTSLLINRKWFKNLWVVHFGGLFYLAIMILYLLFSYGDIKIVRLFSPILMLIFVYMGYFYFTHSSRRVVNFLIKFSAICFTITLITSCYNLLIDMNVSRILTSSSTSPEVINYLESRNIASFDLIYGAIILLPIMIATLKNFLNKKANLVRIIYLIGILLLSVTMISLSNFTTAYMLLILAIGLSFFIAYKNIYLVSTVLIIIVFTFYPFFNTILILVLDFIKESTPSIMTKIKLTSIISSLNGENDLGSISIRSTLIYNSFSSFISHPFIGRGAYYYDSNIIGNHSQFTDDLGRYGIIGFLPKIFFILYFFRVILNKVKIFTLKNSYIAAILIYLILGFLNPVESVGITFAIFFIAPLILRYNEDYFKAYKEWRERI